eukprot:SM000014S00326  [mRNA]  locus=s14:726048:727789:+ [translate_table: standard]
MYSDDKAPDGAGPSRGRDSNAMLLAGESLPTALLRAWQLGGQSALALRLLLGGVARQVETVAGVEYGDEFRAARKAAEEVGAQLVLGDRPIEITLRRTWRAMGFGEKLSLIPSLLQFVTKTPALRADELEEARSEDAITALFEEVGARFPSLLAPLVYERDMYLAWSLKRSKAVNGTSKVVGVIGRGHMRGVVYALTHNQEELRFKDLVGGLPDGSKRITVQKVVKVVNNLIVEGAICYVAWYVYTSMTGGH